MSSRRLEERRQDSREGLAGPAEVEPLYLRRLASLGLCFALQAGGGAVGGGSSRVRWEFGFDRVAPDRVGVGRSEIGSGGVGRVG